MSVKNVFATDRPQPLRKRITDYPPGTIGFICDEDWGKYSGVAAMSTDVGGFVTLDDGMVFDDGAPLVSRILQPGESFTITRKS